MLFCKGKTMSTINLSNKAEEAINEAIKISDGTWSRDFIRREVENQLPLGDWMNTKIHQSKLMVAGCSRNTNLKF